MLNCRINDQQLEQVCKSIQCISMAVLLGCVMLKVSLYKYYKKINVLFDDFESMLLQKLKIIYQFRMM